MNAKRLQLVTIVVPLLALVLLDLVRRYVFPAFWQSLPGAITLLLLVGAGIAAFSWSIFRAFDRLQTTVRVQKEQMEELYNQAQTQANRLDALYQANLALGSDLALEKVLQRVVDLSRELLDARYAALGVLDEDGKLRQFITSGIDAHTRARIGPLPHGLGLLGYLMHKGEPIRVDDIQAHPESVGFPPNHPPMKTLLGIPLFYKGELQGDLYLTEKAGGLPFDEKDEELILLFGAQAAAALANSRLAQQLEGVAVVEERHRFAMDLHDGIIQSLFAIGLTLESIAHRVEDDPEAARDQLRATISGLDEAIQDMRGYIVNLRPGRFGGKSLSAGLADLAREIRMRGMTQVKVVVEEGVDESLRPVQTTELFHIAREALTNVVKHAGASLAAVRVEWDDDLENVVVTVHDNGAGFDLPSGGFPEQHHGLRNMRQRVEAIGGTLEVESAPSTGTTLRFQVPVPTEAPVGAGTGP
ncbi:MAG TPA: GAF domain-containing sensor histidine kinase [Ardenticatenaceae bacterium]|nr:GAF domain-containing sensor histidine kinase [Ardenticatenaceae bacterium]